MLKQTLYCEIENLIFAGIRHFYTGMALGVDQWAALAVLELKKVHPEVKLSAVLPCETQAVQWTPEQRHRYYDVIMPRVDEEILLQRRYTPDCMFKRNRWLVDHAEYLLAVCDETKKGGTVYTVRYARQQSRKIIMIDPETLEVRYPGYLGKAENQQFRVVDGKKKNGTD